MADTSKENGNPSQARRALGGACLGALALAFVSAAATSSPRGAVGPPVLGRSFDVEVTRGLVRVKPKGSETFRPLTVRKRLAFGSWIDATAGEVQITSAAGAGGGAQAARFSAGKFRIFQTARPGAYTEIRLEGGDFGVCDRETGARAAGAQKTPVRQVWGNGEGRFRTVGRFSAATVIGTIWLTEDRCDGTLTRVRRGTVGVRDFARHRTVVVEAGESYLALPK